jgi:pimeloyl-ACP methyl ester carboxylesterase
MIAMDQRNAGRSAGPLEAGDPWGAYAADQLAVIDHLGIDRFLVFGCCIGGPFILKLCELAPGRVVAAVLEQPVGITTANRELFDNLWKPWGEQPRRSRQRRDRGVRHHDAGSRLRRQRDPGAGAILPHADACPARSR